MRENAAAHWKIRYTIGGVGLSVLGDALSHLAKAGCAVGFAKGLPRQGAWQLICEREHAAADNEVTWRIQLEQKQLSGFQRP